LDTRTFNTLFTEFLPELLQTTRGLKERRSGFLETIGHASDAGGRTIFSSPGAGIVLDGFPCDAATREIAFRFVVDDEPANEGENQLVAAATSLSIMTFIRRFSERLAVRPQFIFESSQTGSSARIMGSACLSDSIEVLSVEANTLVQEGNVGVKKGALCPLQQHFCVRLSRPNSGGAAAPSLPAAASHLTTWLSQLTTRKLNPLTPARVLMDPLASMSKEEDVDARLLKGVVLAVGEEPLESVLAAMRATLEGLCRATGCEHHFELLGRTSVLLASESLNALVESTAATVLGSGRCVSLQHLNKDHSGFSPYLSALRASAVYHKSFSDNFDDAGGFTRLQEIVEHGVTPLVKVLLAILLNVR